MFKVSRRGMLLAYTNLVKKRGNMSKSLKDFAQNKVDDTNDKGMEKQCKDFYEEHKNKSSLELQEELMKEVANQKLAGTFDYDKLTNVFETMKPYLNNQQIEYVNRLLQGMK